MSKTLISRLLLFCLIAALVAAYFVFDLGLKVYHNFLNVLFTKRTSYSPLASILRFTLQSPHYPCRVQQL